MAKIYNGSYGQIYNHSYNSGMKYTDVIGHYKTQQSVAQALNINQASIAKWAKTKAVPHLRQLQLESLTGGALKADKDILPSKKTKKKAAVFQDVH